jgi:hypothetical protein
MPKTNTTTADKTAPTKETPAPVRPTNPARYAAFVEAERAAVNGRLEGYFKDFIKNGLSEEKHFLTEVFTWRESGFGNSGVKAHGEHEIPLFSAIQDRLDGMHLVPVDSAAMVFEVEKFITDKLAAGWKEPVKDYSACGRQTEEVISERLRGLVARQVQFFASRCKQRDLNFMIDLLEQWETLTDDDEFWKNTKEPLAAAAEIHLDVMKRREKEWGD